MCETKGVRNKPLKPGHFNLAGKRTFQNGFDMGSEQFTAIQRVVPLNGRRDARPPSVFFPSDHNRGAHAVVRFQSSSKPEPVSNLAARLNHHVGQACDLVWITGRNGLGDAADGRVQNGAARLVQMRVSEYPSSASCANTFASAVLILAKAASTLSGLTQPGR